MYQTKVEVDHSVESWFVGMHSQEYLSQGAELLFHNLFSNMESVSYKESGLDRLQKYLV